MTTDRRSAAALEIRVSGGLLLTVLVYKRPDSRVFLYNKSERPALAKRDAKRHRQAVAGVIVLGVGFLLQLAQPWLAAAQLVR